MSGLNRRAAFRSERADLLAFCASLGPADWRMNSRAAGWSIQDCVAHLASGCHALFGTGLVKVMRNRHIEQFNDDQVELRRDRLPAEVVGEYRRWSRLLVVLLPGFSRGPLARVEVRLAELGRFPARLVPSAAVFDHHTHLRHDMAPALGRPAPGTDANRMAVTLEWMMAVLSNQLRAARPAWLDRPLSITLDGPGGGTWLIEPTGAISAGRGGPAAARIGAVALEFPEWATRRAGWRERKVCVAGDADYGERFLDVVNIV